MDEKTIPFSLLRFDHDLLSVRNDGKASIHPDRMDPGRQFPAEQNPGYRTVKLPRIAHIQFEPFHRLAHLAQQKAFVFSTRIEPGLLHPARRFQLKD